MTGQPEYLECRTCGEPVRLLTSEQVQRVALNPDSYIAYCSDRCRLDDPQRFGGFW